jgi:hypothetical protein
MTRGEICGMTLRQLRVSAVAALFGGLMTAAAWGHPTPYGDTYTFSGENFPNNFGVVKDAETEAVTDFGTPAYSLTFDGIAENVGEMRVNERAVVWPGKAGIVGVNPARDPAEQVFPFTQWENPGEVIEISFESIDGEWVSNNPGGESSFTVAGIDWPHAVNDDTPSFLQSGFYFYFTDDGVAIDDMTMVLDTGVYVGPHPFDPSVPEVAYITYSQGQVDRLSDPYPGGVDLSGSTRQLAANASWAQLQAVLSIPPASGNGFVFGYLVDIETEITATSGDFNGDGAVDTIDYDILRGSFQQEGGFADGDINFDGAVDLADFVDFKTSYQLFNGAPLQSVPEPGTFALAALTAGIFLVVRRRRVGRVLCLGLASAGLLLSQSTESSAQFEYAWLPVGPTAANWNLNTNWNPNLVPSQPLGGAEAALINNGGRAYIDANLPNGTDPVVRLILGRETGTSGAVEIRSGGTLGIVQNEGLYGEAQLGASGTAVLDVLPGGSFSAYSLTQGGVNSQLNASGNASVVVQTSATLGQTTKISGPSVNFTAAALTMNGTLVADITSGAHSPIVVSGQASLLSPTLKVQFTGHTPAFGDEFALIDATRLVGKFGEVDTSAAPTLADGLEYRVSYGADATANLKVDNTLVLAVDPDSGASSITNIIGASISLDGYSILSAGGHLADTWAGLRASDVDWLSAAPTVNALSELNLSGATAIDIDNVLSLGTILSGALAEADRDLIFEYTAGGEVRRGLVTYEPIVPPDGVPGDTNNDGKVDLEDLNAVRNNFGATGSVGSTPGDAYPFDGVVDLEDLNGVRNNFGAGSSAAVPEPATLALGAISALGLVFVARKRR